MFRGPRPLLGYIRAPFPAMEPEAPSPPRPPGSWLWLLNPPPPMTYEDNPWARGGEQAAEPWSLADGEAAAATDRHNPAHIDYIEPPTTPLAPSSHVPTLPPPPERLMDSMRIPAAPRDASVPPVRWTWGMGLMARANYALTDPARQPSHVPPDKRRRIEQGTLLPFELPTRCKPPPAGGTTRVNTARGTPRAPWTSSSPASSSSPTSSTP